MVVGKNVSQALQPYHEFECTGTDDKYVIDQDLTEEARKEYDSQPDKDKRSFAAFINDWYGLKALAAHDQQPDLAGDHKYGHVQLDERGEVVKVVKRTNPNKKWDWWVIGGRFSGRITLKPGAQGTHGKPGVFGNPTGIDQCNKGDIDFDTMKAENARLAAEQYDHFATVTQGTEFPPTWKEVREKYEEDKIDLARAEYANFPMIKAMRADKKLSWCSPEAFGPDKQAFIDQSVKKTLVPFAMLVNGKWHERGSMGWFGMVSDEKEQTSWEDEFQALFDAVPDDETITMVDCHI